MTVGFNSKKGGRSKEKVTHRDVCTAVAKISAYLRCGNMEAAREWADKLVSYLIVLELYPAAKIKQ